MQLRKSCFCVVHYLRGKITIVNNHTLLIYRGYNGNFTVIIERTNGA